jgi:MEMO1 family protein
MIRAPAVAGRFYPSDPSELSFQIGECVAPPAVKSPAIACVVPHAGYMYSGHVAGAVYARLELPRRLLLLGPRHFPKGDPLAIFSSGAWSTPLGNAEIDEALASDLCREFPRLRDDPVAHASEHSLEVQIPFLQELVGKFSFVPVVLGTDRFPVLEELGHAVARVVAAQTDPIFIVCSSDMNHYESDELTRRKDRLAIDRILALDARGLYDTVRSYGISMCGYAPAVATVTAAAELGAKGAELVRYGTSGDVTGDRREVVGYAGLIIR